MIKHILIFTGGGHPANKNFKDFMDHVVLPDYVIAADSGLLCARAFGYMPNVIIGDMDSLHPPSLLEKYPKECIRLLPHDKDDTDTVAALKAAVAYGADFITLCGGDGGRVDHLLGIVKQFERKIFPNAWLCSEQIIFALQPDPAGEPFTLYLTPKQCDSYVSFFAVPNVCTHHCIHSEGLIWPLDNVAWDKGQFSLSNRITKEYSYMDRNVVITVKEGRFIAVVPYS